MLQLLHGGLILITLLQIYYEPNRIYNRPAHCRPLHGLQTTNISRLTHGFTDWMSNTTYCLRTMQPSVMKWIFSWRLFLSGATGENTHKRWSRAEGEQSYCERNDRKAFAQHVSECETWNLKLCSSNHYLKRKKGTNNNTLPAELLLLLISSISSGFDHRTSWDTRGAPRGPTLKQQHRAKGGNVAETAEQQLLWKEVFHFLKAWQIKCRLVEVTRPSSPAVTHLAQKERPLVSLDWCCCRACPAGAAGSCTGRCPPAAAAAGSGWRWCRWGRAQGSAGPSPRGTGRRRRMEGCRHADASSGTASPRAPGPSAASGSPPPRPSLPRLGRGRGARPSRRRTSLPALCPLSRGHLQRGQGITFRTWPVVCWSWGTHFYCPFPLDNQNISGSYWSEFSIHHIQYLEPWHYISYYGTHIHY